MVKDVNWPNENNPYGNDGRGSCPRSDDVDTSSGTPYVIPELPTPPAGDQR